MYKVVDIDYSPYTIKTLFRSAVADECWYFVKTKEKNRKLYVVDKIDVFVEPPEDVKALRTYNKLFRRP